MVEQENGFDKINYWLSRYFIRDKRVQVTIHLEVVRLQHCRPADISKSSLLALLLLLLCCPIYAKLLSFSSLGNSLAVYNKYKIMKWTGTVKEKKGAGVTNILPNQIYVLIWGRQEFFPS